MTHTPEQDTPERDTASAFTFDFTALADPTDIGVRWSTWGSVEPLMRGPHPRPDWLVTSAGALDSDLGVLKTGKEADVHLLERRDPHDGSAGVVMAAKRYRGADHRSFHRAADYTEGRTVKRSRDQRALKRNSTWGRKVAAAEWATSEWQMLVRCWSNGVPVPYPVQIDGPEILMEWITGADGASAPRLAATRPGPGQLVDLWDQLVEAMGLLAADGLVHGDLSPYNVLVAGDRLVLIDLPQVLDLYGHHRGTEFLHRDCTTMARWFTARGLARDPDELLATVLARGF